MAWPRVLGVGKGKGHSLGIHLGGGTHRRELWVDWTGRVRKRLPSPRWRSLGGDRGRDILAAFDHLWFEFRKWPCH